MLGLISFWVGGFAVQSGGLGDNNTVHLAASLYGRAINGALDHELGFMAGGHYWGLMGDSSFFLITYPDARNAVTTIFLGQAALLVIALVATMGAALERGRIMPMAVVAFVIGAVIYPLFANWTWGGGWLAALGRDYGLGNGFVDIGGAGVVHETAGVLALALTLVLGPRYGRFIPEKKSRPIAGHNLPFVVLGAVILLLSWMAANALFDSGAQVVPHTSTSVELAAVNTLLAAGSGLFFSLLLASWRKGRPEPVQLCRGLLGGAVASCGCCALIDPWAAFIIGGVAGLLVQGAANGMNRRGIDDPTGAIAVHGLGGAWGVLATGLFANNSMTIGFNGVGSDVRGLFFGGAWHQLAAQAIGGLTCFVVVFVLGYACFGSIKKIFGLRVALADETGGLDWPQIGALGYQGDAEPDDLPGIKN